MLEAVFPKGNRQDAGLPLISVVYHGGLAAPPVPDAVLEPCLSLDIPGVTIVGGFGRSVVVAVQRPINDELVGHGPAIYRRPPPHFAPFILEVVRYLHAF